MKIDIFPHIMPRRYFDRMLEVAPPGMALQKRMSGIPVLVDVELRLRIMDRYEGYVQVLTLANPPIEVARRPRREPRAGPTRQRRDGGDRRQISRALSRIRRLAADEQSRRRGPRDRPRDRRPGRDRCPDLHERRGPAARRAGVPARSSIEWRSAICRSGCTRRALPPSPTTRARRGQSSTCGGRSAGRTRRRSRWGVWSSRVSSTATPS